MVGLPALSNVRLINGKWPDNLAVHKEEELAAQMKIGRISLSAGVAIAAVGVSAITAGAAPIPNGVGGGPIAQQILGSGSDTTQFMMSFLDYGYEYDAGYGSHTAGGCQQLSPSGTPPQWLDFSCAGPQGTGGDVTRSVTDGSTTSGSATIDSATANFVQSSDQGRGVYGSGIPAGSYIVTVNSATEAVLNQNATATATGVTLSLGTIVTDNYRHDQPHGAFFLGSGSGINQLCQQGLTGVAPIDYARSSRALKSSDCTGLDFVAYARDGISWEAFNVSGSGVGTTVRNLTQAQLQGIYVNCSITNWNQVGGNNVPIVLYTAQAGSGTRSTFDTFLGGAGSTACMTTAQKATNQIPENNNEGIPAANRPGAIFPFSFGIYATQEANPYGGTSNSVDGSFLGNIDGVAPNVTTIRNGTFPYTRYLYNVVSRANASQATMDYVGPNGWICKTLGEHANASNGSNYHYVVASKINAAGFVPLALQASEGTLAPYPGYCIVTGT
jgi:hypothetical protein